MTSNEFSAAPIRTITSRVVYLPNANIDTDQIIPARFLKTTSRAGLGRSLFADWRYDEAGIERADFPLNREDARGAEILVAGDNFGCGSSREHAPWALHDFGFRAVVSTSIADIFRSNALKNGLVPVVVSPEFHKRLAAQAGTSGEVTIDLDTCTIALTDGTRETFPIDKFARYCLMQGVDELGFLLSENDAIASFESNREAAE
jgi:3-isopropylmalate/(R)-2-methylmalate dehydratase small subunit